MVWRGVLSLLSVLLAGAVSQNNNFMGGAMSFRFITTAGQRFMVEMTYLTGWKINKGPCGLACNVGDLGMNTKVTREFMLSTNGADVLGISGGELSLSNGSTVPYPEPIELVGKLVAVNSVRQWEQELAVVLLLIDPAVPQTEISLSDLSWREYDYRYEGDTKFRLYQKIIPHRRNDTGEPNNSPLVMFKPLYTVPLNTGSMLRLAVADVDGDFVRCETSVFISASTVKMLNNTRVNKDCSVLIEANEADGFVDGGTGVVTVRVSDYNRKTISLDGSDVRLGGERLRSLSDVNFQFMVETVKTDFSPQFVAPTRDSQHVFTVYVGASLRIPLHARPSSTSASAISSVSVRTIPDIPQLLVPELQNDTQSGEGFRYTTVTWLPTQADVGVYVMGASVTNVFGLDGIDRNYVINVREKSIWDSPGIPSTNLTYECPRYTSCTVPVYSTSAADKHIMAVRVTSSSLPDPEVALPRAVMVESTQMYISDVTVLAGVKGNHDVCVKAIDDASTESAETCLHVAVSIQDPCWSGPCYNGQCASEDETYTCMCGQGYTGVNCEQAIATCESGPCLNGAQCFEGLNPGDFVCLCRDGFTGTRCQTGNNTASIQQPTTSTSTLQGGNSTPITQKATSPPAKLGQQQRLDSENPDESTPSYVIPVVVSSVLLVCAVAGALLVWRRFFHRKNKLDVETDHVIKEDDGKGSDSNPKNDK